MQTAVDTTTELQGAAIEEAVGRIDQVLTARATSWGVPLRLLRQLPLPFSVYHELIASLRRQSLGATPQDSLVAELAEASATALREALGVCGKTV
jgi:hypothetical protein